MTVDVNTILAQARDQRLWGSIQIEYQDGRITVIRKTETIKPTAEGTTPRVGDHQ